MDFNLDHLIGMAIRAIENSYSPYSHYRVGAALITKHGDVFTGTNIENASYSLTMCAERVSLFNAINSGINPQDFFAMVVVTRDGGTSCGACRQVMSEFNRRMLVFFAAVN